MKRCTGKISLGFILLLFCSCKKDGTAKGITNSTSIVGAWEIRQVQNGMIPTIDYSSGNGNILKFSDSTYEKYTNNNIVKSGHYIVIEDDSVVAEVGLAIPHGQFTHRIVYDNDFGSPKTFFQIANNKLTFLSGFFPLDGGSNVLYQRIENNP
jgi:hypothetical protein